MSQIKAQLQALIDSVEKIEETSEGQLLGGFAIIGGSNNTADWNENCNCNCDCGGNGNCDCNCGNCSTNRNCSGDCKPTTISGNGAGFTMFSF